MSRILGKLAIVAAVLPAAEAILVSPNSPCSPNCGNVLSSTSPDDLACSPGQYTSGYHNSAGPVFQSCLQCELGSSYTSASNYTDIEAALYNLRYGLAYCLFNEPAHSDYTTNPCITSKACGVFRNAINYQNLSTAYDDMGYCDIWPTADTVDYHGCIECLQVSNNYLANFVTVLHAGCLQKPVPGVTLGLKGNVFSSDVVNITAPTPTAAVDPAWFDHGPLTLGAKVGIAVGGFVLLLILAGVAIVWNGKRRRKAFLRKLERDMVQAKATGGWPSPMQRGGTGDTPLSQRPLRGWDDSPMTINTEKTFPRYISPYSSQFNSPISASEAHQMPWPEPALHSPRLQREIGLSLGDHVNYDRWPTSPEEKGKMREESYEMYHVDSAGSGNNRGNNQVNSRPVQAEAPILSHPGYGRNTESPPKQYDATEHDARNGPVV